MDETTKEKVVETLSALFKSDKNELIHRDNLLSVEWLMNYLEANLMPIGSLWDNVRENVAKVLNESNKCLNVAQASYCEAQYLRTELQQKQQQPQQTFEEQQERQTEILTLLNEAIRYCPFEEKQLLARLFYLRASQLSDAGDYKGALKNINFAIRFRQSKKYILHKAALLHKLDVCSKEAYKLMSLVFDLEQIEHLDSKQLKSMIKKVLQLDQILPKEHRCQNTRKNTTSEPSSEQSLEQAFETSASPEQSHAIDSECTLHVDLEDKIELDQLEDQEWLWKDFPLDANVEDNRQDGAGEDASEDANAKKDADNERYNFEIDHRLCLEKTDRDGRFFVAKEDLPSEQTIFRERAYSNLFLNEAVHTRCQNCLKAVINKFFPCKYCNEIVYCGEECAEQSYDMVHRLECGLYMFWLNRSKSTFHTFKLLNRFGIDKILALQEERDRMRPAKDAEKPPPMQPQQQQQQQQQQQSYGIEQYMKDKKQYLVQKNEDQTVRLNSYRAYLDLVNHHEKYGVYFMFHQLVNSIECALVASIRQGYDMETMPRERLLKLIEICLEGVRRISINSFQWSEHDENGKRIHLATCLCLIGSLFNHRCDYNTDWTFENGCIYLVTNRTIKKGEEISICYGCSASAPFEDRLKQNQSYFFQCNCGACMEDAKTVLALQCPHCPGPVILSSEVYNQSKKDPIDAKCMLCYEPYPDAQKVNDQIDVIHHQVDMITRLFGCGLDKQKFPALLAVYMRELSNSLYRKGRMLVDELNKCCQVLYDHCDDYQINKCIHYGRLVDEILPLYDEELNPCDRSRSELKGITKMVMKDNDSVDDEIDWMIFWSDLFRKYQMASLDDSVGQITIRFHRRLIGLLDYQIAQKQNEILQKNLKNNNNHNNRNRNPQQSDDEFFDQKETGNKGQTEELKLLKVLRKFKQDQLDSISRNPKFEPKPPLNVMDLIRDLPNIV